MSRTTLGCVLYFLAMLATDSPGARSDAYEWFREAMDWFEKAEAMRPHGNDDAILRWNTCARIILKHDLAPMVEESYEPMLQE